MQCMREADTIARLSVDEFAVLLEGRLDTHALQELATRILGSLRRTLMVGDSELPISASIGVTVFPQEGADVDVSQLLGQANAAMQRAKQLGGNCFEFYHESLHSCTRERLLLEAQLDKALERGQLEVFYQPKLYVKRASNYWALKPCAGVILNLGWYRPRVLSVWRKKPANRGDWGICAA